MHPHAQTRVDREKQIHTFKGVQVKEGGECTFLFVIVEQQVAELSTRSKKGKGDRAPISLNFTKSDQRDLLCF